MPLRVQIVNKCTNSGTAVNIDKGVRKVCFIQFATEGNKRQANLLEQSNTWVFPLNTSQNNPVYSVGVGQFPIHFSNVLLRIGQGYEQAQIVCKTIKSQ